MNAPSTNSALAWHEDTHRLGVHVQAYFFNPAEVDSRVSFVERFLPVFTQARPRRLGADDECASYIVGGLTAQPDAVLEHGNGLLCLTYRHSARWLVDRARWRSQLRVDAMLQSIAGAMAVSGAQQRPSAALLRLGNALLQFAPGPLVLECLASHIDAARRYWNVPQAVTATQLASFCEPVLRALPGVGSGVVPATKSASMSGVADT